MSDPTECVYVDSDTMQLEPIGDVAGNCVPQTNQPDARQEVNNQALFNRSGDSIAGRPKMPDIMVGTVQKSTYVDDESKNKRGVSKLKYPVEHGTTDWDDAGKGVDYVTVLINGMEGLAWILVLRQL